MKRRILATLLAATAVMVSLAQVRWLETEHDFGAFNEDDGKVSTEFKFVNDSESPVTIDHVRSSCGCTVPQYSKATVNHGDTAAITVVYNPSGRPGRFSKSLMVKLSNDSTEKLLIKGVVIGAQNTLRSRFPVTAGPIRLRGNMVTFGAVKTGKIKSQFVEVYNSSHSPVVPRWTDIPQYLRVTAAHETVQPGEQGVYSFVLAPTKSTPYGILTDSLTLNVPGEPPFRFEIAAIVEEDFSGLTEKQLADAPRIITDTDMLDFGDFFRTGQPITRQLRVTNTGKNDLLIRRAHTSEPGFTVKAPFSKLKKGKSGTVTVTFDPASFSAPLLNSRLQVITNDPSHPLTTIRLVGIPHDF
ncbi:MAG: DUF1573 domain-containing protein [Muribaculaceae bacterium]